MFVLGAAFFLFPVVIELFPREFRWFDPCVSLVNERMLLAMYFALGICLMMGAKDPLRHAIIIDYTIISSLFHGGVMLYYAFALEHEMAHLTGDVPMLFIFAIGFWRFHPRRLARAAA